MARFGRLEDSCWRGQFAWEALALLKRRAREENLSWERLLRLREQAEQALRRRLAELKRRNAELAERARAAEELAGDLELRLRRDLEVAAARSEREKAGLEEEAKRLRLLLEQARRRQAAESARWQDELAAAKRAAAQAPTRPGGPEDPGQDLRSFNNPLI
ncbi:MAG: hypothetical protein KGO96_09900 [Elusimicrobia bacterium]|nr:hypothetical protein [Elusimicrobiota bacterium]MDE2426202.1 hypothetical protein [Elusimicrobiota bacterium]